MPPFNLQIGSWKSATKTTKSKADQEKDALYEKALEMNREQQRRKTLLKFQELRRSIETARREGDISKAQKLEREFNSLRRG